MKSLRTTIAAAFLGVCMSASGADDPSARVYVVPNFHPASCGWLTDWSTERSFCANSYFDHLDRVRDDANYQFAISEVNNMIAMLNFKPERIEELKKRIAEGRVEAVNGFFLEPTVCLSGGEALVRQGVEGLRWQKEMLGVEPRLSWMIDVTGTHEQMAQIVSQLGLEALIQCRLSASGSTVAWLESPDGTRTLGLATGGYSKFGGFFRAEEPLRDKQVEALADYARKREHKSKLPLVLDKWLTTPDGLPFFIPGGSGDYSLSPLYKGYPSEFLATWKKQIPDVDLRIATMTPYLDEVLPLVESGAVKLPVDKGGWEFGWNAFWIQNPTVKQRYRQSEHDLQAAEMLASIASLRKTDAQEYPSQDLNHAWLLMMLNMDRNTLWGAAGGMVFEHDKSWDAKDRFDWTDQTSKSISTKAIATLAGKGGMVSLFNPLNWTRTDPVVLELPGKAGLGGVVCQALGDGTILARPGLGSVGCASFAAGESVNEAETIDLPGVIETGHYEIRIDPKTGDLKSLKLRKSGREILGASGNVLVAENSEKGFGNQMLFRPARTKADSTSDHAAEISVTKGPLATVVEVRSPFHGGKASRRVMRFYNDHPRIDFDTYLEDIPDRTVVVSEFPLAGEVTEVRRGIPYGFSHGWWNEKQDGLHGKVDGITPAVRWSHYTLKDGGGFAIIDHGLSGREINGNTPVVYLMAATENYNGHPCSWLSGKGKHHLRYAIVAHDESWEKANIPRMAWEFNSQPVIVKGTGAAESTSQVSTSPNLILQSIRREGSEIELRMAECLGVAGKADVKIKLPHQKAELTDMVGKRREPLKGEGAYAFEVRPQQIVTIRLTAESKVAPVKVLTDWTPLVPEHKREALHKYYPEYKGHTGRKH